MGPARPESGRAAVRMGRASARTQTTLSRRGTGEITPRKGMEYSSRHLESGKKGSGSVARKKGKASIPGQTVTARKAPGKTG